MEALLLGLGIGLAAGISPGPLLLLVVTAALRSGWRGGVLAACAPLLSDVLVVTGVLLVLEQLPGHALGWIALFGAAFVAWTGVRTVREARTVRLVTDGSTSGRGRRTLGEAALLNLLSPHPWVAWATVLGPLTVHTWRQDPTAGVLLVAAFYLGLVGAKAVIAGVVARFRSRLGDRGYRRALTGGGVLLVAAAAGMVLEFAPVVTG